MNQEIVNELRIIELRNGVQISIEKSRADILRPLLEKRKFIEIDGRVINTVDVIGIFLPIDVEAVIRRKNGQWQSKNGEWHNRGEFECKCGNVITFGKTCGNC